MFSRSILNRAGDRRENELWIMDLDKRQAAPLFEASINDSNPAWSPDGASLAFLRHQDDTMQLYLRSDNGGTVCALTALKSGVDDFSWSPDGLKIAFTSAVQARSDIPDAPPGVRIFTRANYRNGNNYTDESTLSQIWVVDVSASCNSPNPRQITQAATSATLSFWSNDAKTVFFTTNDTIEAYYGGGKSSLRSVTVADGAESLIRALREPGSGEDIATAPALVPSPDGRKVAFTYGSPDTPSDFAQDDIFVMDLQTGVTSNVTAGYDREAGGDGFAWLDDRHIIAVGYDMGNTDLIKVDIDNLRVTPVWTGDREVRDFRLAARANRLIAVASDFVTPPELYEVKDGEGVRLTSFNRHLQAELALTRPEAISFKGPGGQMIHGWLQRPPAFDPVNKYPLIVWAHGGPYAHWSSGFNADVQAMAAAGYLVMYVNPRGSSSYGQDFASALAGIWPGPEYDDIMAGVDFLISRPYVDETRIGIAGGSAGGILTDWAITRTQRFKSAVSISDIADNYSYWFVGDQPDFNYSDKQPWLDKDEIGRSPITHGLNITTPTLFISGTRDFRTPASAGGEMMFRLLKYLRVPTALIQFDGAGHVIHGSPDPRHQGLSIYYLLRWMDKHLNKEPFPESEVQPATQP